MAILNNSNAISAGGYDINNSLRFRSSASAYLNRTPASAGNRQIMTYSFWVKRGALTADYNLTNATTDASNSATLYFNSSNNQTFDVFLKVGATNYSLSTSQVFRDPSAWYHIVVAIDTTQATASNRIKVYVNGTQVTAFLTANYVPQNSNLALNNNVAQYIGYSSYFDGYMAEINFIDGQALTPSSFGSTNAITGVWQPAKYTGTYGTNGFYLNFSNIALTSGSNTGLGKDYSGNGNYWNTNNISVTSGTTYDAMTDSPTNTSATVANYCVLNPLDQTRSSNPTNGNLSIAGTSSCRGTFGMVSESWYYEFVVTGLSGVPMIGIADDNVNAGITSGTFWLYRSDGNKQTTSGASAYGSSWTSGDIIGIAYNASTTTLTFYKNNVSQGNISVTSTGTGTLYPMCVQSSSTTYNINFGQRPFSYTPPTGYLALNTFNLPNPTILKGNKYMDATLWTGDGNASQTVVNSGSMKPDFLWAKCRSTAGTNNVLIDSVRGTSVWLASDSTAADASGTLSTFLSNGIAPTSSGLNTSTRTYVGWQWQAGAGSTSTNTSGTISSTVSVNTTAGFSIVTYTGTGANATVGHGLGVAPKMVIVKNRTTAGDEWCVWHTSLTNATYYLYLNGTAAQAVDTTFWNSTAPTSTVINLGSNGRTNRSSSSMVCYTWAEIAGYSKFGSYTGNGSADGPFVYTGFRPAFILFKNASAVYSWMIKDNKRANPYNVTDGNLYPDLNAAEDTGSTAYIDLLSNGFKMRGTSALSNGSGNTIIYAAFAENPFKNSLAR